jgi:hypothetical protein
MRLWKKRTDLHVPPDIWVNVADIALGTAHGSIVHQHISGAEAVLHLIE